MTRPKRGRMFAEEFASWTSRKDGIGGPACLSTSTICSVCEQARAGTVMPGSAGILRCASGLPLCRSLSQCQLFRSYDGAFDGCFQFCTSLRDTGFHKVHSTSQFTTRRASQMTGMWQYKFGRPTPSLRLSWRQSNIPRSQMNKVKWS